VSRFSEALGVLLGIDVLNPKHSDRFIRHLQRYFANYPCDLLIDCGANTGQFALMARMAGFCGEILSIEPLADPFAKLAVEAALDPRWKALQLAVGAQEGELDLSFKPGSEVLASALPPQATMLARFSGLEFRCTQKAPLRRLDKLLAERGISSSQRVFLKSDTQGLDLDVLKGLGTRLSQVQALALEMSVCALYERMPSHWELLDFARVNGFEPYGFATVTRDSRGGMIEYDALFRRRADQSEIFR
jgi:FkbM family methyltransferase